MKALSCALVILLCANFAIAKEERFNAEHFAIIIPEGMTVDERGTDSIALVFEGDEELQNGTLSVSARESENPGTFEARWSRIRKLTIARKKVIFEREEEFSGLKWKVIAVCGKTGGCEIQDVLHYSFSEKVSYFMHYHCQPSNCGEIQNAFAKIQASFQPKSKQSGPTNQSRGNGKPPADSRRGSDQVNLTE
jgi:hypothetical protein